MVGWIPGVVLLCLAGSLQAGPYEEALQKILQHGDAARTNWQQVTRDVAAARKLAPQDPRTNYAQAIVLEKKERGEQALKIYQDLKLDRDTVYLPAWQGVIRWHLSQGEVSEFLQETMELVTLIADEQSRWTDPQHRLEAAAWLGRVERFLALSEVKFLKSDQVQPHQAAVERQLTGELQAAYVQGKKDFELAYLERKNEVADEQLERKLEQQGKTEEQRQELEEKRDELETKKEELKLTAQEWKQKLNQELSESEKQLEQLQRDYQTLNQAARQLNSLIQRARYELGQLETQWQLQVQQQQNNPRPTQFPPTPDPRIQLRREEIFRYQQQYNQVSQRAAAVVQQGNSLLQRRQQLMEEYQTATGELVQQDKLLDRWKKNIDKSELKNKKKANAPVGEGLARELHRPDTWFGLDWPAETARLTGTETAS